MDNSNLLKKIEMKKTTQHNQLTKAEKIEALVLFGSGALFILAQVIRLIFNF